MRYIEKIGYASSAMVRTKLENIEYYPFHLHNDAVEIICVLNGTVKIYDAAASYTLSYGDVHIFNKNDPHKIVSEDPENIILTVHFDADYYTKNTPELLDAYFICDTYEDRDLYSTDIKHLRFHLARIHKEYNGDYSDIKLEEYATALVKLLLNQFQQYVYKKGADKPANIVRLQNLDYLYENYDRMYRIVDYIYCHFREKIKLEDIAAQEFLNKSYLSSYIKNTLGLSFTEIISLTRCEEVSRLLSATKKTIDQIAEEVGFSNRKHLAIQFKKWFQQTPTEYRSAILNDLKSESRIKLRTFDYDYANVLLNMYLNEY